MTEAVAALPLIHVRHLAEMAATSGLYRSAARGELAHVSRGVYAPARRWAQLSPEEQHLVRMRALAATRRSLVYSHRSAALAWGLPLIGSPPSKPETLAMLDSGARSDRGVHVHRTMLPFHVARHEGFDVTGAARTLLDVSRRFPAIVSVPMLDAALRSALVDIAELEAELAAGTHVGSRRASFAIEFSDAAAMSPGESVSRVQVKAIGLPAPQLQAPFFDALGKIGEVDFWWRELNVIGEFDGFGKYVRDQFLLGRTPAEAVYDEKRREDRLRATKTRPVVVRWGWEEARHPHLLRAVFERAGIRLPPR